MFLLTFSIFLLIANFYYFFTNKYMYLFIPCMLFLPDYYGVEFSGSLPILTVSRMMAIVFYIYAYIHRRRDLNIKKIKTNSISKEYYFLFAYFVLRIISNIHYITTYGQAAKTIGLIILEQLFLLIAFYLLSPTSDEILKLLKYVVFVASYLFVVGIIESITRFRPFDELHTVSREMLNEHFIRLGLLRATTTMHMPGFYGNMCILVLPLIMYLYDRFKQKRYLICASLCIMAVIHSGSRSDLFYLVGIFIFTILFIYRNNRLKEFIKNTSIICIALVSIMAVLSLCSPYLKYFYEGTAKSFLNEVGFDFDLSKGAPEGVDGYGENTYGSASRIEQFGGIYDTLSVHPLFGYGSGAEDRKDFHYYRFRTSKWYRHNAYDVGLVEIICDEGLIGLFAFCGLFVFIFLTIRKTNNNSLKRYYYFLVFTYLMSTLSTANMMHFLFLFILIFMHFTKKNEL